VKMKKAQHLLNVKTLDLLSDRELTRAIRDAIIAEEDAIKQYEVIVDSTENESAKAILQDIANEEKVHVGELQKLLADLLPDEEGFLEEGAEEAEEEISSRVASRFISAVGYTYFINPRETNTTRYVVMDSSGVFHTGRVGIKKGETYIKFVAEPVRTQGKYRNLFEQGKLKEMSRNKFLDAIEDETYMTNIDVRRLYLSRDESAEAGSGIGRAAHVKVKQILSTAAERNAKGKVPEAFKKQWKKNDKGKSDKSDDKKEDSKPDFLKKKKARVARELVAVARMLIWP